MSTIVWGCWAIAAIAGGLLGWSIRDIRATKGPCCLGHDATVEGGGGMTLTGQGFRVCRRCLIETGTSDSYTGPEDWATHYRLAHRPAPTGGDDL